MKPLHIIHLEDNRNDAELIRAMLAADGMECTIKLVDTAESFMAALAEQEPDLILADYQLPSFDGLSALKIVKKQYPHIPFILLSGVMGEEFAIDSLKSGATDYVLKNNLTRLTSSVKRAVHQREEIVKRIQAENELQRLNAAIEHSSDAVITTDPDGTIEYVNPAFENMTGYRKHEVLGKNPSLLQSGAHSTEFYRNLWQTITNGHTWHGIITNKKKDGRLFTEDAIISPILRENGETAGFVAIKRDITQALEIEKQHQRHQLIRRSLADIFLTTPDDKMYEKVLHLILESLPSRYGLFGYINENNDLVVPSLAGDIWEKCRVPGKDISFPHSMLEGKWAQALWEKKAFFINGSLTVPDEHIRITNALFVPILYQEEVIGLLTIANKNSDYTGEDQLFLAGISEYIAPILHARLQRDRQDKKRRQAEAQIKEYSENLKSMVEERTRELNRALYDAEKARERISVILKSVASGLIVTDRYNKIELMNRLAEILIGIHFTDVFKQSIETIFPEPEVWREIHKAIDNSKTYTFDFKITDPGPGKSRILRARISGLYDAYKKKTGVVTIINDFTQEHEIDRLKSEFISTAAHEFRTPLTSIQGFSEILLTRNNLSPAERKKFLNYINKQAVNLAMIVNDLLDLSRIEAETVYALKKTAFHLVDIIDDILPVFREGFPRHEFRIRLSGESDEVFADKDKIKQVLTNIIGNAVKYSPKGGAIEVSGELAGNSYQVAVKDEGIGMTPEQVEKIYDKFYRADSSDDAVKGTGLGMTIVKLIVEEHGDKVQVNSELGVGTTVLFTVAANVAPKGENA